MKPNCLDCSGVDWLSLGLGLTEVKIGEVQALTQLLGFNFPVAHLALNPFRNLYTPVLLEVEEPWLECR